MQDDFCFRVWYGIHCRYIIYILHYMCIMVIIHSFRFFPIYCICIADGAKNENPFCKLYTLKSSRNAPCKTYLWILRTVSRSPDVSCRFTKCPETTKLQQKFIVRIEATTCQWSFMICTLMSQQPIGCFDSFCWDCRRWVSGRHRGNDMTPSLQPGKEYKKCQQRRPFD